MAYSTSGQSLNRYRERTNQTTKKMPGVSFLTFKCKVCREVKPVKGRKSNGYKAGFRCFDCVSKALSAA